MKRSLVFDSSSVARLDLRVVLFAAILAASGSPAEATFRMATGTYVGDGSASLSITNVGFSPDLMLIKGNVSQTAVMHTATMPADASKLIAAQTALVAGRITSLDADGFTVGSGIEVNESGTSYYWTAFKTSSGEMVTGTYTGGGVDTTIALPFQPAYVVVMSDAAEYAIECFTDQPFNVSDNFAGTSTPDAVEDLITAGFLLGTAASVNADGVTYHYAAWKSVAGQMAVGSYIGDGNDNVNITGPGFKPKLVSIGGLGGSTNAVFRPDSLSGDQTYRYRTGNPTDNKIQALLPNGFQIGTGFDVNKSGSSYYWAVFKDSISTVPALDIALSKTADLLMPNEGEIVTYTVTVTNNGPIDATGVTVADTLPAGLTYSSHSATLGSYVPASGRWDVGALGISASHTLDILATVDPGTGGTSITNTSYLAAVDQPDSVSVNDVAAATITVNSKPMVVLAIPDTTVIQDSPPVANYRDLNDVFTDTEDGSALDFIIQSNDNPVLVTATIDAADSTLDLAVAPAMTGSATVVIRATDSGAASVDETVVVTVIPTPDGTADLMLAKTVDIATPAAGDTITYTIVLTNNGPDGATGVVVTDSIPSGVTFVSSTASQGSYDSGTSLWTVGAVANGDSATLTITCIVDAMAQMTTNPRSRTPGVRKRGDDPRN
jgi:uncharacterized repeat protein (TIGR01451 family)